MLTDIYCKDTYGLFETSIVQQTAFWSEVKKKLGIESIAIDFKCQKEYLKQDQNVPHDIQSDVLLVIQRLDRNHCIAYVPYGPELSPQQEFQGRLLEELSESLRPFLPKGCIMIRYDLCWESLWAKDKSYYNEKGEWNGPPDKKSQELRFNFNTQYWNLFKAQTNILPSNTLYLNLKPSTEDILGQMKPKTRYNIGLSKRKGVEVRHAGIDELDVWYELYKETAIRNGIYLH
ncbi:MAG: peptidoglycan bridge formation glycyltransferase FemA/FemB family protein, partial [Bacteroidales bacterium]|nr:peptidoglycan bridge formation glycyltransferase FemA/FemB family protein [Bacteroidales bacterium]